MSLILRLVRALSCFQASEPILDSCGRIAFLADVFGNFVQRVDADVQDVVVFVIEAHGLLHLSADFDFLQSRKLADTVVDVRHKIAGLQFAQYPDVQGLVFGEALA
jgi:hypothetical protein